MTIRSGRFINGGSVSGGGGGGEHEYGMLVGIMDDDTVALPTERPDGEDLQNEDYVKVSTNATLPLQIEYLTFTNYYDKAYYYNEKWHLDPGKLPTTEEIPLSNSSVESISGTATYQKQSNIEFVENINHSKLEVINLGSSSSGTLSSDDLEKILDNPQKIALRIYSYNVCVFSGDCRSLNPQFITYTCIRRDMGDVDGKIWYYWCIKVITTTGAWTAKEYTFHENIFINLGTSTSGTLNSGQLSTLNTYPSETKFILNNQVYFLNNNNTTNNTKKFSNIDFETSDCFVNYININCSNGAWELLKKETILNITEDIETGIITIRK